MYDVADDHDRERADDDPPLSHEPLCIRCGHSAHVHLPCGGACECEPTAMPGEERMRG